MYGEPHTTERVVNKTLAGNYYGAEKCGLPMRTSRTKALSDSLKPHWPSQNLLGQRIWSNAGCLPMQATVSQDT